MLCRVHNTQKITTLLTPDYAAITSYSINKNIYLPLLEFLPPSVEKVLDMLCDVLQCSCYTLWLEKLVHPAEADHIHQFSDMLCQAAVHNHTLHPLFLHNQPVADQLSIMMQYTKPGSTTEFVRTCSSILKAAEQHQDICLLALGNTVKAQLARMTR